MNLFTRKILVVTACCLQLACTPMEWRRSGEVAGMDSEVFQRCSNQAMLQSMRFMPFSGFHYQPVVVQSRRGRIIVWRQSLSLADQTMIEHTALMDCMQSQGFKLEPITPEAGKAR